MKKHIKNFYSQKFYHGEHKVCKVKKCHTIHYSHGYCNKHYKRKIRTGGISLGKPSVTALIKEKVTKVLDFPPPLNPRNQPSVYKVFKGIGYNWIVAENKWVRS